MMEEKSDIEYISRKIQQAIIKGNLIEFIKTFTSRTSEKNASAIKCLVDGKPSLITACEYRRSEMVKYILQNYKIDTDCIGICNIEGEDLKVKPLWLATVKDDIKTVELLINNGASVNDQECGSTPLQEACIANSVEMVKLLVSNGANPNVENQWGLCLRHVIENPPVLRYLLENGADPNLCSKRNYPLIHLAIASNNLESVRILQENNCDWTAKDFDGNDAVEFAALSCNESALEYLLSNCQSSPVKRCAAYELMGCAYSGNEDYDKAVRCWKLALNLSNGDMLHQRVNKTDGRLIDLLDKHNEPTADNDIDEMIEEDLVKHSLVVMERVLSPQHPETIHRLSIFGMVMGIEGNKEQAMNILQYVYTCISNRYGGLSSKAVHIFTHLLKVCGELIEDLPHDGYISEIVKCFKFVLQNIRKELQFGCDVRRQNPTTFCVEFSENFIKLMALVPDIVYMICDNEKFESDMDLTNYVALLISKHPVDLERNSILHFALCRHPKPKLHTYLFKIKDWHYNVSELLLKCRADPNCKNDRGETPLHAYLRHSCTATISEDLVQLLLKYGAHCDVCDQDGIQLLDSAKSVGINIDEGKQISLKCIAAKTVLKFGIEYNSTLIPECLIRLIDIHRF